MSIYTGLRTLLVRRRLNDTLGRIASDKVKYRELVAANDPEYAIVGERLAHLRAEPQGIAELEARLAEHKSKN